MNTAVILGANGQLGTDVCAAFAASDWRVVPLVHTDLDIATATVDEVAARLREAKPGVVVNAAANADVEGCERDPARAFAVNATGVRTLARAAATVDTLLIHISTDYVYDGTKGAPYVETDVPRPLQVYGNSKLAGEYFVRAEAPRHAIVRSSGLYGAAPCRSKQGDNFVRRILRTARETGAVSVVDDEAAAPTSTASLAAQLVRIAGAGATGIFHAAVHGRVTWYDFATAVFELTGTTVALRRTTATAYQSAARRPAYSALENARLGELGLDVMPEWRTALQHYLATSS